MEEERPLDEHPDGVGAEVEPAAREVAEASGSGVAPEVLTPEQAEVRRRLKRSAEVQAGRDPDLIPAAGLEAELDREVDAAAGEPLRPPNAEDAEAAAPMAESP